MSDSSAALPWVGGYTRLYTFPTSLHLSRDDVIEDLLADVPMFGIGLLSFGVFTFFLVMKRVNVLAVILYTSVLMAFVASILDLSHVLAIGQPNGNNSTDQNATTSLITAREVSFAISIGLRFFFFWLFVAEPPRKESVIEFQSNLFNFSFKEPKHSGAWGRWGLGGIIAKYSLLAMVFIIGVLQIDWRVASNENRMGAVYGAEATMEIVASALFILKLILNACITPVNPVSAVIRSYAAIFLALVINLGLGIGNVITFAFSESTLGRFLQAVEFYILILYILISSFYNFIPGKPVAKHEAPFQGLPESKRRSTFRISPFRLPADPFLAFDVSSYQNPSYVNEQSETPSRQSITSRLSSWIASQRLSKSRPGGVDDPTRLWDQDQAERGQSPVDLKTGNSLGSLYSYDSVLDKPKETSTLAMHNTEGVPLSQQWATATLEVPSRQNSFKDVSRAMDSPSSDQASAGLQPPRFRNDSLAAYSIGSYYGGIMNDSGPVFPPGGNTAALAARNADSPVYGLDGITQNATSVRKTSSSPRSTVESLTDLLRKQMELDNSIAGLRGLSPKSESKRDSGSGSDSATIGPSNGKDRRSSTLAIAEPSATRSEFSLSSFPEPPTMLNSASVSLVSISASTARADGSDEGRRRSILKADGVPSLPLPRMPILDDIPTTPQSIPHSPGGDEVVTSSRMGKFDSAGTQYDVTSFIGHLTTPGFGKGSTLSKQSSVGAGDGSSEIFTKPTHARKQSGNLLVQSSTDSRSNISNLSLNSNRAGAGEIEVVIGRRGPPAGGMGLPARPKLTISGPRLSPQDGQAPSAFERPRPPPLILQQPNGIVTPSGRSL